MVSFWNLPKNPKTQKQSASNIILITDQAIWKFAAVSSNLVCFTEGQKTSWNSTKLVVILKLVLLETEGTCGAKCGYCWLHNLILFQHSVVRAPRHHSANVESIINFNWIQNYHITESSFPVRHAIDLLSHWQGDCSETQVDVCIPPEGSKKEVPLENLQYIKRPLFIIWAWVASIKGWNSYKNGKFQRNLAGKTPFKETGLPL